MHIPWLGLQLCVLAEMYHSWHISDAIAMSPTFHIYIYKQTVYYLYKEHLSCPH